MDRPKTLLLVDDEPAILELLAEEFSAGGIHCITSERPLEAFEIVKSQKPDAILSDINMPGLDGISLLRKIREAGIETPLIFLTGFADKEKVTQALRLGASDFHEKPFDRVALKRSVNLALELGFSMRNIDAEIEEALKNANLPPEQAAEIAKIKRKLLLSEKTAKVYFKKSG